MKRFIARLLWMMLPPEPFYVFEEIKRYGDEIVCMTTCQGDLWIATKRGLLYRMRGDIL